MSLINAFPGGSSGGSELSELEDVTLSSAANGDILKFNGTKWVNDKKFNYSTTEQVVGTWIDGKPLYQKTVLVNISVPVDGESTTSYILVSDLNINDVIDMKGMLFQGTSANSNQTPIFFSSWTNTEGKVKYIIQSWYNKTENKVCVDCNRKLYEGEIAYITLQYTKTTD